MNIPFSGIKAEYAGLQIELDAAVKRVLGSGRYVLGDEVTQFEAECAGYLGIKHVIGVASGTEAIALALWAYGIGVGHEVITTDVTAFPTVNGILMTGASPVFVDIDSNTGLIDVSQIEAAITPRTKAIIPVHLYGQCVEMERVCEIAKHCRLVIIEDCAQAFGSLRNGKHAGTLGDIAAYSFYPTKNLGAAGDGGAVATNDDVLCHRLLRLRNYGQTDRYRHETFGINSRLDELQAAILRTKLPYLDSWNERRNAVAKEYIKNLNPAIAKPMRVYEGNTANYHLFVVRVNNRERFRNHLAEHGIETLIHYPIPCSKQHALPGISRRSGDAWAADQFTREVVSLPLYPQLSDEEVESIVSTVNGYWDE